jgi:nucleoside 2-deoxyribosyltransferase
MTDMKKYFVAYRNKGETAEFLEKRLRLVMAALHQAGIDSYCNFFDQQGFDKLTVSQITDKALAKLDACDGLFALVVSSDRSEGQLIEFGYALAKNKPIIAAIQQDAKTYMEDLADQALRWQDLADLKTQLESLEV